jgi:sulfopyruvate decarboxylase subunit beta
MRRRAAIEILSQFCRESGAASVATMQASPVWHEVASDVPLHIDMLGCMGSASSLGLGLALGIPNRRVVVIDGDGCLLMQLGTLVTIANARPKNLTLVIMNNQFYETSGNQSIPGAGLTDIATLAGAAGFRSAHRISDPASLKQQIGHLTDDGPTMLVLDIDREEPCEVWPALSMKNQIQVVRGKLAEVS